ncbi:hypothetical protein ACHAXT_010982 [Thalassiosira profunda]
MVKARPIALALALLAVSHFLVGSLRQCSTTPTPAIGLASIIGGCDDLLLKFDERFDHMREARRNVTLDPKHVDYLSTNKKLWFDSFEPEANCFSDERFGSFRDERDAAFGDGPKFTCGVDVIAQREKDSRAAGNKEGEGCLVYSVGSYNDILFERTVHEFMGCEVHTFDPTLGKAFVGDHYSTFHPWGLGEDGVEATMGKKSWVGKSMGTIMKELGHTNRTIDILIKLNQLQVEMHAGVTNRNAHPAQIVNFFSSADQAGLRIFHKERNHWGCDGYTCVEYALTLHFNRYKHAH